MFPFVISICELDVGSQQLSNALQIFIPFGLLKKKKKIPGGFRPQWGKTCSNICSSAESPEPPQSVAREEGGLPQPYRNPMWSFSPRTSKQRILAPFPPMHVYISVLLIYDVVPKFTVKEFWHSCERGSFYEVLPGFISSGHYS